jgi:hypothetical protein
MGAIGIGGHMGHHHDAVISQAAQAQHPANPSQFHRRAPRPGLAAANKTNPVWIAR